MNMKMNVNPKSVLIGMVLALALLEAKKMVDRKREGFSACPECA
jgi:hypothetical protein